MKKLIIGLLLMPLLVSAAGLELEQLNTCELQYVGESCVAELKITNNSGKVLDGKGFLHIDYQGVCSSNVKQSFDGEGIQAWYNNNSSSDWNNGDLAFSDFNILEGESYPKLKIETVPALCPGEYTFIFTLEGAKAGEIYPTRPTIIGGGGGGGSATPPPSYETGDINKDGKVDKYDFALMMAAWGKTGVNSSDLNGDNKVDKYDFALLMLNWS